MSLYDRDDPQVDQAKACWRRATKKFEARRMGLFVDGNGHINGARPYRRR